MYLANKYTRWYYSIVANAQTRVNQNLYYEKHHIVPKSLGGSDDVSNLVDLTAKEHFICHRLLVKMTEGKAKKSMAFAIWQMSSRRNKVSKNRYKPTARIYELLKKQLSDSCKGIPLSEEHKQKMRGIPKSEEHKQKLRKPKSEEHKQKISLARKGKTYGHKHSEETKKKISASNKGKHTRSGTIHSDETKQRMREARLAYWAAKKT